MINGNRVIAVEEHFATPAFLKAAHELDVLPGDETEVGLMRQVEDAPHMRSELVGADNTVTAVDLVFSYLIGRVVFGVWLRESPPVWHFKYSCHYDSLISRCSTYSAGSPC